MISWIIDQIPLWVYITIGTLFTGAMFYFFSPILIPLWNVTPRWVKVAGGTVLAVFLAYVSGRNRGNKNAREEQKRRDARAVQTRQEIHDDVAQRSPDRVKRDIDKWMRD